MYPLILISFLFLPYLPQVSAAVEYLTQNEQIRFFFPDNSSITLEYWIPSINLQDFDWLGFGLQSVKDTSDNFKLDLYFSSKDSPFQDGFLANTQSLPSFDEDLGGTSDIVSDRIIKETYIVYAVNRKLLVSDKFDVELSMDTPFMVKTFKGYFDELGGIDEGTVERCEYLVVNNYYLDRNEDEVGVYGPRAEKPNEKIEGSVKKSFQSILDVYADS